MTVGIRGTRRAILEYLRRQGAGTAEALAEAVGVAPVTARHHLLALRDAGLVEPHAASTGRGRPRHVYHLTPRGAAALAENHLPSLAGRLLDLLKQGDPKAAERFFREMAARLAEEHRQAFEDQSVERRLDVVVELLSGEGFTVRWEQDGDSFLVHELGCPYESLGVVHREVCCMDLGLIQEILPGEVVRERWRMEGDPACAYRVRLSAALEPAGAPGGR